MKIKDRIMQKVVINPSGCWLWTGAKGKGGYGNTYAFRRYVNVHRLMYEIEVGPIPEGQNVCHTCNQPLCCNPDHLYIATQRQNLAYMRELGRDGWGKAHSEAIKRGWTKEAREHHSQYMKRRRREEHEQKAREAGVSPDLKFCPRCKQWFPRTFGYWHKNAARADGLKNYCRFCRRKQSQLERQKKRASA